MQNNENTKNEWDIKLDTKIEEVKQCQVSKSFKSCTGCSEFFDCELRKKYVIAVYESMNQGSSGGFEF